MIRAYPHRPSVIPGDTLLLHVSTNAPRFRVDFYRQGGRLVLMKQSTWNVGRRADAPGSMTDGTRLQDWDWPGYHFRIPTGWLSGVYIAMLVEGDGTGSPTSSPDTGTADGRAGKALFVVKRPPSGPHAAILYKLPLFTYHAYNQTDGKSLYTSSNAINSVTMRRPGGGTGGDLSSEAAYDPYAPASPRNTFAHWDAPFIEWLEGHGYHADYCTDLDVHEDPSLLSRYDLLLSVGHDEYWSQAMRDHVEAYIRDGGNVVFFGGNTCWWRVHLIENNTAFFCDKSLGATAIGAGGERDKWWSGEPQRPENSLTGVSYRNGGGWFFSVREALGYTVQDAGHWVYEGTGLQDGEQFGAKDYLIGYECDGAAVRMNGARFQPAHIDGTPAGFTILGIAILKDGTGRNGWFGEPREPASVGPRAATLGLYQRGPSGSDRGIVFTAATTDWARVVASGAAPHVERITQNVLTRLSRHNRPSGILRWREKLLSEAVQRLSVCMMVCQVLGKGAAAILSRRQFVSESARAIVTVALARNAGKKSNGA